MNRNSHLNFRGSDSSPSNDFLIGDEMSDPDYSKPRKRSETNMIVWILVVLGLFVIGVFTILTFAYALGIHNDLKNHHEHMNHQQMQQSAALTIERSGGRGNNDDDDEGYSHCPEIPHCPQCPGCPQCPALPMIPPCPEFPDLLEVPCEPEQQVPRIECTNYNPQTPPPGWPELVIPWATRANEPAATRCNLTPPLINNSSRVLYDAYQRQSLQGGSKVIMIDVRTPEEIYWIGLPTQVNSITLKNTNVIVPDFFTATLNTDSTSQAPTLEFTVNGMPMTVLASDVASTDLTGVSYNVPVEFIDTNTGVKTLNPLFGKQVDAIIRELQPDRVIFYCRSGQRSSIGCYYEYCPFEQLFPGVLGGQIFAYEVEGTVNGFGGVEGTSYKNSMLGYRGFPGRYTADSGPIESVSFKDSGLPIKIGTLRKTVKVQPNSGATISLDSLDALPWAESQP